MESTDHDKSNDTNGYARHSLLRHKNGGVVTFTRLLLRIEFSVAGNLILNVSCGAKYRFPGQHTRTHGAIPPIQPCARPHEMPASPASESGSLAASWLAKAKDRVCV